MDTIVVHPSKDGNDQERINVAIRALEPGGTLILEPGTYYLTAAIDLTGDDHD